MNATEEECGIQMVSGLEVAHAQVGGTNLGISAGVARCSTPHCDSPPWSAQQQAGDASKQVYLNLRVKTRFGEAWQCPWLKKFQ